MKINSYQNLRYSFKTKTLNLFRRFTKNKNCKFFHLINGEQELIEFPQNMVDLAQTLKDSIPDIKLEDVPTVVHDGIYEGSYPIIVSTDKKSLIFGVPLAKTRMERELGIELYMVTISKYNHK